VPAHDRLTMVVRTRRVGPLFVLVAVATAVAAAVLAACAGGPLSPSAGTPSGDPAALRRPELADVTSFALALGVDPLDGEAIDRLAAHDLVVVDGATAPSEVAALQARGALVLGYLSVGTVEPYRPWFAEARDQGWLLDRWADWDEWYADTSAPGLRSLLLAEGRKVLSRGFDGLFLDNADMVADHPRQADGMIDLVTALDAAAGDDGLVFAQNGDDTVDGIAGHLDGWNREDVSATYDFEADEYRAASEAESRAARATLRRLRADGLLVTTTDYTSSAQDAAAADAVTVACREGAVPFVSDIDLRRIPARPVGCSRG